MTPDEVTVRDLLDRDVREIHRTLKDLREQGRANAEASSRAYAEVRAELREVRTLVEATPTEAEFGLFRRYAYARFEPLETDLQQRAGASRERWSMWRLVLGGSAIAGTFGGTAIWLMRTFVFPA